MKKQKITKHDKELQVNTNPQTLLQKEVKKLKRFKSPEGIARKLKRLGIKGVPHDTLHCPLAEFLTKACGRYVEVCDEGASIICGCGWGNLDITILKLPPNAQKFVENFDEHEYQYLRKIF